MRRIEIKQELGSEIVTREHGRKLREIVEGALSDPPVAIDFGGLQINSVSFFDEAFGQLAVRCGEEELDRKIQFEGLDKFDTALLRDIISSRSREAQKRKRAAS
jgi:hypothetical protein